MVKKNNLLITFLLGIIVVVLIIIVIKLFIPSGEQSNNNNLNEVENYVIDMQGQKITSSYVELSIINRGTKDYELSKIEINGCGFGSGGSLPQGYNAKSFNVICDSLLTEGAPFVETLRIIYNILGYPNKNATFETTIAGNVGG